MLLSINGLRLALAPKTLNLLSLAAAGRRWLAPVGKAGAPLWRLLAVDAAGRRVTLTGPQAAAATFAIKSPAPGPSTSRSACGRTLAPRAWRPGESVS